MYLGTKRFITDQIRIQNRTVDIFREPNNRLNSSIEQTHFYWLSSLNHCFNSANLQLYSVPYEGLVPH